MKRIITIYALSATLLCVLFSCSKEDSNNVVVNGIDLEGRWMDVPLLTYQEFKNDLEVDYFYDIKSDGTVVFYEPDNDYGYKLINNYIQCSESNYKKTTWGKWSVSGNTILIIHKPITIQKPINANEVKATIWDEEHVMIRIKGFSNIKAN